MVHIWDFSAAPVMITEHQHLNFKSMVSSSTLRNHHYQGTTTTASVHQSARIPSSGHFSARQTM
jgi:hypothetical protein